MIFPRIIWCYCILIFQVMCRDPPIVKIKDQGMVSGMFITMHRTQRIIAYLGIPYAMPPIDSLRFAVPVINMLPAWEGIRNGSIPQPKCLQNPKNQQPTHIKVINRLLEKLGMDMDNTMGELEPDSFSENCLYLNIYAPDAPPPPGGYAVIAYIHSGDFSNGSPFEIDPFQLVFKQKLIVVTLAFRLGILGFFTTLDGESAGNYGLMDQAAAFTWIKHKIKAFGGNDDNITLMGHGSGATSICTHLTSKEWTRDVFHKAIVMSGTHLLYDNEHYTSIRPPTYYSRAVDRVATNFGCNRRPTSDLMGCLRRVEAKVLIENTDYRWGPIIDDGLSNESMPFIADMPVNLVETGQLRNISLLIGFTDMEDAYELMMEDILTKGIDINMYNSMINDIVAADFSKYENNETMCLGNSQILMDSINFQYRPYPPTDDKILLRNFYLNFLNDRKYYAPAIHLAQQMAKQTDVYAYRFDLKPRTMVEIPEDVGVPHGFEQIFVWGLPYAIAQGDTQWDNSDKRVSDIVMTLWANFAKYTNPTQVGVYIKWDKFTTENPGILIIDKSFNMSDFKSLNFRAVQFWNDFYPSVINFAAMCCNSTESAAYLSVPLINTSALTLCLLAQLSVILHYSLSIFI